MAVPRRLDELVASVARLGGDDRRERELAREAERVVLPATATAFVRHVPIIARTARRRLPAVTANCTPA
jgi:hypothetical protein